MEAGSPSFHRGVAPLRVFRSRIHRSSFRRRKLVRVRRRAPETWSLPIVARKGHIRPPPAELALQYREAQRLAARKIRDLEAISAEYERHIAFHNLSHAQMQRDMEERVAWIRKVEDQFEDRTRWAMDLKREKEEAIEAFRHAEKSEKEAWRAVSSLSKSRRPGGVEADGSASKKFGRKLRAL